MTRVLDNRTDTKKDDPAEEDGEDPSRSDSPSHWRKARLINKFMTISPTVSAFKITYIQYISGYCDIFIMHAWCISIIVCHLQICNQCNRSNNIHIMIIRCEPKGKAEDLQCGKQDQEEGVARGQRRRRRNRQLRTQVRSCAIESKKGYSQGDFIDHVKPYWLFCDI